MNNYYKVVEPEKLPDDSTPSLVSLIADAILREPDAVQLIAYCPDNCLEMEKKWELMRCASLSRQSLTKKHVRFINFF